VQCYHWAIIRLQAAWRHHLACAGEAACRHAVECYRRWQTTTDDDIYQRTLLVWPPYPMCRQASNKVTVLGCLCWFHNCMHDDSSKITLLLSSKFLSVCQKKLSQRTTCQMSATLWRVAEVQSVVIHGISITAVGFVELRHSGCLVFLQQLAPTSSPVSSYWHQFSCHSARKPNTPMIHQ